MALATTSAFASFDINSNTSIQDISDVLSEALLLDFTFMERGMTAAFDEPVYDTTFIWNQEALNSDLVTTTVSQASNATSIVLSAGHGARVHIGDLIRDKAKASTETIQVTDVSTDTLTVTRTYNSTVAMSLAAAAVLVVEPAYQEASDIGADKTVRPSAFTNFTQIVFAGDLIISRSQLARKMATNALDVDRQLANRAKELKRSWTSIGLYGEKSASAGSDSVYRTTGGLRNFIRDNSGVTNSTGEAISLTNLNSTNTSIVDKGAYVDTLVIGTDLVSGINAIEASNRRLVESDRTVGYNVQRVLLGQGNEVDVIVDGRVATGDAFLYRKADVIWHPLDGHGMFVIAATDFTDGVKRRIGSEAGMEIRHPEAMIYVSNKTSA